MTNAHVSAAVLLTHRGRAACAPLGQAHQARQDVRLAASRSAPRPSGSVDRRQEHRQGDGRQGAAGEPPPFPRRRRDAGDAVAALIDLVERDFDEARSGCRKRLTSRPAGRRPGLPRARWFFSTGRARRAAPRATAARERADLEAAIAGAIAPIRSAGREAGGEAADILEFQVAMLEDDALDRALPTTASSAGIDAADRLDRRRSPRRSQTTKPPTTTISAPAPPISAIFATGRRAVSRAKPRSILPGGGRAHRRGRDADALPLASTGAAAAASPSSPAARRAMSPCSPARAACR